MAVTYDGIVYGLYTLSTNTKSVWDATNEAIPAHMMTYESDTKQLKIGNGVAIYSALPYLALGQDIAGELLGYLQKAGAAGGVLILDQDGIIPLANLPASMQTSVVVYVDDIAARDALTEDQYINKVVYVRDATADPSVEEGGAAYIYVTNAFVKWSEDEMFDLSLSGYLDKTTETLDHVLDGEDFVRTTVQERADLTALGLEAVLKDSGVYNIAGLSASNFTS